MKMPAVEGIIERRLLVNYRVAPGALAGILPAPFRPKLVGGYAIAGICLIRLASVRPRGLPAGLGLRSENAAHRIAVEWDADGRSHDGVFSFFGLPGSGKIEYRARTCAAYSTPLICSHATMDSESFPIHPSPFRSLR